MVDPEQPDPEPVEPQPSALLEVADDPAYQRLLAERSRFSWVLTTIMLTIFFGYILLIAFAPDLLARRIGDSSTTVGIPIGIGVILCGILMTGIYVRRANSHFDPMIAEIVRRSGR